MAAAMSTTAEFLREHDTAPKPDNEKPRLKVDGCVGCGQIHRGLMHGSICLEATIRRLRNELHDEKRKTLAAEEEKRELRWELEQCRGKK